MSPGSRVKIAIERLKINSKNPFIYVVKYISEIKDKILIKSYSNAGKFSTFPHAMHHKICK